MLCASGGSTLTSRVRSMNCLEPWARLFLTFRVEAGFASVMPLSLFLPAMLASFAATRLCPGGTATLSSIFHSTRSVGLVGVRGRPSRPRSPPAALICGVLPRRDTFDTLSFCQCRVSRRPSLMLAPSVFRCRIWKGSAIQPGRGLPGMRCPCLALVRFFGGPWLSAATMTLLPRARCVFRAMFNFLCAPPLGLHLTRPKVRRLRRTLSCLFLSLRPSLSAAVITVSPLSLRFLTPMSRRALIRLSSARTFPWAALVHRSTLSLPARGTSWRGSVGSLSLASLAVTLPRGLRALSSTAWASGNTTFFRSRFLLSFATSTSTICRLAMAAVRFRTLPESLQYSMLPMALLEAHSCAAAVPSHCRFARSLFPRPSPRGFPHQHLCLFCLGRLPEPWKRASPLSGGEPR